MNYEAKYQGMQNTVDEIYNTSVKIDKLRERLEKVKSVMTWSVFLGDFASLGATLTGLNRQLDTRCKSVGKAVLVTKDVSNALKSARIEYLNAEKKVYENISGGKTSGSNNTSGNSTGNSNGNSEFNLWRFLTEDAEGGMSNEYKLNNLDSDGLFSDENESSESEITIWEKTLVDTSKLPIDERSLISAAYEGDILKAAIALGYGEAEAKLKLTNESFAAELRGKLSAIHAELTAKYGNDYLSLAIKGEVDILTVEAVAKLEANWSEARLAAELGAVASVVTAKGEIELDFWFGKITLGGDVSALSAGVTGKVEIDFKNGEFVLGGGVGAFILGAGAEAKISLNYENIADFGEKAVEFSQSALDAARNLGDTIREGAKDAADLMVDRAKDIYNFFKFC